MASCVAKLLFALMTKVYITLFFRCDFSTWGWEYWCWWFSKTPSLWSVLTGNILELTMWFGHWLIDWLPHPCLLNGTHLSEVLCVVENQYDEESCVRWWQLWYLWRLCPVCLSTWMLYPVSAVDESLSLDGPHQVWMGWVDCPSSEVNRCQLWW